MYQFIQCIERRGKCGILIEIQVPGMAIDTIQDYRVSMIVTFQDIRVALYQTNGFRQLRWSIE